MTTPQTLLSVRGLATWFEDPAGTVRAVDGVSFDVSRERTVALVGESGCGKTVTALSLARLLPSPPAIYATGRILLDGRDVLQMSRTELVRVRGREIAYVFQEPGTALNPVLRLGRQVAEAVRLHRPDADPRAEALELLKLVGLPHPERLARMLPYEISGGMQQRVMIAMALISRPRLLVADEPTTALDVTIQAQILELLTSLQDRFGMAVLLITHNLGLVAGTADTVNVMYAGRIVEYGTVEDVLRNPMHPYTGALLRAVPTMRRGGTRHDRPVEGIPGTVPHPARLPPGCKFAPRCPRADSVCHSEEPELCMDDRSHGVRCRYPLTDEC